jgi:hypothetical protein
VQIANRDHGWRGLVGVVNAVAAKAHQARSHEHSWLAVGNFGCADLVFGGRVDVNEFFSETERQSSVRALIASRDKYRDRYGPQNPFHSYFFGERLRAATDGLHFEGKSI